MKCLTIAIVMVAALAAPINTCFGTPVYGQDVSGDNLTGSRQIGNGLSSNSGFNPNTMFSWNIESQPDGWHYNYTISQFLSYVDGIQIEVSSQCPLAISPACITDIARAGNALDPGDFGYTLMQSAAITAIELYGDNSTSATYSFVSLRAPTWGNAYVYLRRDGVYTNGLLPEYLESSDAANFIPVPAGAEMMTETSEPRYTIMLGALLVMASQAQKIRRRLSI